MAISNEADTAPSGRESSVGLRSTGAGTGLQGKDSDRVPELWLIALGAFILRLAWGLLLHPAINYVFSDMAHYSRVAAQLQDNPLVGNAETVFFPIGTGAFLAMSGVVEFWVGLPAGAGSAFLVASMGAGICIFGGQLARLATKSDTAAMVTAALLAAHYPLISLGGYFLSEVPYAFFLLGGVVGWARFSTTGGRAAAWSTGTWFSVAVLFRTEAMLVFVALLALSLGRTRHRRCWKITGIFCVVPLLVTVTVSTFHYHARTGGVGLGSGNVGVNLIIGQCHPTRVVVTSPVDKSVQAAFASTALTQLQTPRSPLARWIVEQQFSAGLLHWTGDIRSRRDVARVIASCLERTELTDRVTLWLANVALLGSANVLWPDHVDPRLSGVAEVTGSCYLFVFFIPAVLCGVPCAGRGQQSELFVAPLLSVVLLAATFGGSIRLRVPYDPFLIVLAVLAYRSAGTSLRSALRRRAPSRGAHDDVGRDASENG